MGLRFRFTALAAALITCCTGLSAVLAAQQPAQPEWIAANGGTTGATVYALAGDPFTPSILYAGTANGLTRTLDGGASWTLVNRNLPPGCQGVSLLASWQQPAEVFAGCAGADYGNGLYRSDNWGAYWRPAGHGMLANTPVRALVQSANMPDLLLAATDTGIYRTTDGSRHWSLVLKGHGSILRATALARDPFTPLTYYAAVSTGMVKTVDGGVSWFPIDNDLDGVNGITSVVTDPTRKDRVFLATAQSGVYRSEDGGNSWEQLDGSPATVSTLLVEPLLDIPHAQLSPDLQEHLRQELAPPPAPGKVRGAKGRTPPHFPETALLLAGTDSGVQASVDGGATWSDRTEDANSAQPAPSVPYTDLPDGTAVYALLALRHSAEILAGCTTDGIYRSLDLGRAWSKTSQGLPHTPTITAIAMDPAQPGTVYLGTQGSGMLMSIDSGGSLQSFNDGLDGNATVNTLLLQPARHGRLIVGLGAPTGGVSITTGDGNWSAGGLSGNYVNTIVADPNDPDTLYAGLNRDGVGWSPDGGGHWTILSNGLPVAASILSLAVDPHNALAILAGTDRGLYQTGDQGDHWVPARASGLPAGAIQALLNDPEHLHTFLAGTGSGLYRSLDGGNTWIAYGAGLAGRSILALARDPRRPETLLAGATDGVAQSTDDGAAWTWLRDGIPGPSAAPAVAVSGAMAYAATLYGTSFLSPANPVPAASTAGAYYALTGHSIREPFLSFWKAHGGVTVFGLPRTEAIQEGGTLVQYFERARFEYHSGSGLVTLTPLGSADSATRHFVASPPFPSSPARFYSAQTHHSLGAPFLNYWRLHGGAAVFGYPISEVLHEENGDGSGRAYVLQYFQNARFEYHPENAGTSYVIQLGLLGDQALKAQGWLQ